jgi:hypothetical protein
MLFPHVCFLVHWPIGCALNPKNMSGFLAYEDMMVEKMVDKRFLKKIFIYLDDLLVFLF